MIADALSYLTALPAEQFIRAFWLLVFIEVPRYFVSYVVALGALLVGERRRGRAVDNGTTNLGVGVVIPGHNCADDIALTAASLREQTHRPLEIVVVNDGSTDDTEARCRRLQADGLIDRYVHLRSRGGKSAAVNAAIPHVRQPLLLVTDADTTFDRDAIAVAVREFSDPEVGVVGGHLRVRNAERNLTTRMQHVNYTLSILAGRLVRSMFGFFFVASGAFGLYRMEAVRAVGGWDFGPGEDGDVMMRLRLAGWEARFAPRAVARTDVPETPSQLMHQRRRWNRSLIRNRWRKSREPALDQRWAQFQAPLAFGVLDSLFFGAVIPFLFAVYLVQLFVMYGDAALRILAAVQIVYVVLQAVKYLLILPLSVDRERDAWGLLYVPFYSLANVYFLRFVRLAAVVNELIFRGSYDDPYVPAKVRRVAPRY